MAAPHFIFREFESNGWIKASRALVLGPEDCRELVGGAVSVPAICIYERGG